MNNDQVLSVVLPAYNEEKNVTSSVEVISEILIKADIPFEFVIINDGSKDGTWEEICRCNSDCKYHITGINFSRNFGKEAAVMAGLANSNGACTVVMDCDLQHPADVLPQMYELWREGYEVVEGIKKNRGKESIFYKGCAKVFYTLISKAVKIDMQKASDFKLMDRKVVDSILQFPEKNMFFRALSSWVGYRATSLEFDVQERVAGESKWSTRSLIRYAVTNVVSFTTVPMQIVSILGGMTFLVALIMGIQTLIRYCSGTAVEGFTTVILLLLLTGSIIMFSLGIIGIYISKIYEEIKGRPRYIISGIIKKS